MNYFRQQQEIALKFTQIKVLLFTAFVMASAFCWSQDCYKGFAVCLVIACIMALLTFFSFCDWREFKRIADNDEANKCRY